MLNMKKKYVRSWKRKSYETVRVLGNCSCSPDEVVKNLPANVGDVGLIPGSVRSPREGNDSPFQYSCLENPMDRVARPGTIYGVTKRKAQLSTLATGILKNEISILYMRSVSYLF